MARIVLARHLGSAQSFFILTRLAPGRSPDCMARIVLARHLGSAQSRFILRRVASGRLSLRLGIAKCPPKKAPAEHSLAGAFDSSACRVDQRVELLFYLGDFLG